MNDVYIQSWNARKAITGKQQDNTRVCQHKERHNVVCKVIILCVVLLPSCHMSINIIYLPLFLSVLLLFLVETILLRYSD